MNVLKNEINRTLELLKSQNERFQLKINTLENKLDQDRNVLGDVIQLIKDNATIKNDIVWIKRIMYAILILLSTSTGANVFEVIKNSLK